MIKRRLRRLRAILRRLLPPRGWHKRILLRLAWGALASLMLYFIFNFISTSLEISRLDTQIASRQAENTAIARENQSLQGELEYTESDAYIERAAREQLGMAREGETVVVPRIVAEQPSPAPQPSPQPIQRQKHVPNWKRWIDALRGEL